MIYNKIIYQTCPLLVGLLYRRTSGIIKLENNHSLYMFTYLTLFYANEERVRKVFGVHT